MIENLEGEEWKTLVYKGITFSRYKVSTHARLIGPKGILMSTMRAKHGGSRAEALKFSISPSAEEKLQHPKLALLKSSLKIPAHKAVIETFRPIKDNLPSPWDEVKEHLTEECFKVLQRLYTVDHIDDDPTNNHLNNLQYVTAEQNNHRNKPNYMAGFKY